MICVVAYDWMPMNTSFTTLDDISVELGWFFSWAISSCSTTALFFLSCLSLWIYCWLARTSHRRISRTVRLARSPHVNQNQNLSLILNLNLSLITSTSQTAAVGCSMLSHKTCWLGYRRYNLTAWEIPSQTLPQIALAGRTAATDHTYVSCFF